MGLLDGLFGGGSGLVSQMPNSVSDPGALSDPALLALAQQNAAANPATMGIPNQNGPYSTMNSAPFASPQQVSAALASSSSGLSSLAGMNLGGSSGQIPASNAQASPASQPSGTGGHGNTSVPDPL